MAIIRPLDLKDCLLTTNYFRRYPPEISEMTFTNLFVWRHYRPMWIAELEDTIVFLTEAQENSRSTKVILGPPIGKLPPVSVVQILGVEIGGLIRIPEATANVLGEDDFRVTPDRDNADYVYRVIDLANLEGRRFHKKRNLIAQCLREYPCQYEPITPQLIPECVKMQDRWCEVRDCGLNPGLCNEYNAIREVFTHYERFNLIGGAIRINGMVKAFAVGEELGPETAVCHFEKALPEIQGLNQLINQWFAKYSLTGFTFVNREQDLGIPGLRQAKESYYPHYLVSKYNALMLSRGIETIPHFKMHECYQHILRTDNER